MPPKTAAINLDRDQQILNRLAKIEHKVDSLEQTTAFALRAEASKHSESVRAIFKKSKRRAQVYLAANGVRSVQQIAKYLGMKGPNVSPELKLLKEEGLIKIVDTSGGYDIWAKNPIDHTLRISRILQEEYSLQPDGKPLGPKPKR